MAQQTFKLEIATPERLVFNENVEEVMLPGADGYLGVLAGHAPLLAQLDVGEISCTVDRRKHRLAVSGGYVEVLRDGVQVLAETCEPAEKIDIERARSSKERAEKRLAAKNADTDARRAAASLHRAVTRIQIHESGS